MHQGQQTLDAVDMLDAFVDQAITLAMQPTVIFFGNTLAHAQRSIPSARRADTPSMNAAIAPHRYYPSSLVELIQKVEA
jgi:hypothetical protein